MRSFFVAIALIALTFAGCPPSDDTPYDAQSAESTDAATETETTAELAPCDFPTADWAASRSLEETAWRLFVAANCPSDGTHPLTFENWTEQSCLVPGGCPAEADRTGTNGRFLHESHLLHGISDLASTPGGCSPMTSSSNAPPSLKPFVPGNLASGAKFCEEVFVNSVEKAYIEQPAPGYSLVTRTGQAAFIKAGNKIDFPKPSIEIKVDWLPADALTSPAFDCDQPSSEIYTETFDGVCYAMAGMHISSKVFPNWLWATFEPQLEATNPNRCDPEVYSECSDPWGSNPATSTGQNTEITPQLETLMDNANLAAAFKNYRLVGAQNDFVDSNTTPLGNSFVEFNAQVPAQQASCITCHFYAELDVSQSPPQQNPNFGPFPNTPATGEPATSQPPVPPGDWESQDFSWLLGVRPEGE